MQGLIDHAYHRACQPTTERPQHGTIVHELAELAGRDAWRVHKAWDHCLQRYAEEEQLAWLQAAAYLLPLQLRLQQQEVAEVGSQAQRHRPRLDPRRVATRARPGQATPSGQRGDAPRAGNPSSR